MTRIILTVSGRRSFSDTGKTIGSVIEDRGQYKIVRIDWELLAGDAKRNVVHG